MEEPQNEYPARETLWSFARVGTVIGIVFTPLTIMVMLKFGILNYEIDDKFEISIAFDSAIILSFPCALVARKLISDARCYKNMADIILATILSTIIGLLFSLIPLVPILMFFSFLRPTSGIDDFFYLFKPVPLISALNGFITSLIVLPSTNYDTPDDN